MWESQFVSFLFFVVILTDSVAYPGASSSPFGHFLYVSIAYFHSLIVQAGWFGKPSDGEVSFSFDALDTEIEPCWYSIGVSLFF